MRAFREPPKNAYPPWVQKISSCRKKRASDQIPETRTVGTRQKSYIVEEEKGTIGNDNATKGEDKEGASELEYIAIMKAKMIYFGSNYSFR